MSMIANLNPSNANFEESKRVLQYAAIAKMINPLRVKNEIKLLKLKTGRKRKLERDKMSPTGKKLYGKSL